MTLCGSFSFCIPPPNILLRSQLLPVTLSFSLLPLFPSLVLRLASSALTLHRSSKLRGIVPPFKLLYLLRVCHLICGAVSSDSWLSSTAGQITTAGRGQSFGGLLFLVALVTCTRTTAGRIARSYKPPLSSAEDSMTAEADTAEEVADPSQGSPKSSKFLIKFD